MPIGDLIRDLRQARGLTPTGLSRLLAEAEGKADPVSVLGQLKRWEAGRVIPGSHWLRFLGEVFAVSVSLLEAEATLSRVNRRAFMSLTALVAAHGKLAAEMISSVAGRDPGPLTQVQTTHGTDIVIASIADKSSMSHLRGWMRDGDSAILRVNAAGILAKLPGQDQAEEVVQILAHDSEVRQLYMTAVVSRVCAVDWSTAGSVASNVGAYRHRAQFLATRFAAESLNPRDAGARWCSAVMLRELSPMLGWSPA